MREGFRFALTYKAFFHLKNWLLFSTKQGISMSKAIDIDNREFILYQRQKLIVKRLMQKKFPLSYLSWLLKIVTVA
jgi:hypothetical protein